MLDVIGSHPGALALFLAFCALGGLMAVRWESLSLWMLSTWYSIPLLGGIASLARRQDPRRLLDATQHPPSSVLALCNSYRRFIRVLSRADYDNYMNYLRKAGDLGRRPFPPYLRVVIFSMVLIEAAGLAYVLAGWTLPGASEFAQRVAALGIGFLIAVVLVFFTHWAGLEIDQANRYRRDRDEWIDSGRTGPLYGPDLSLNDPQNVDDNEPAYRQRATRGHGKVTYVLTTITLLMVLAVGTGAAFVRGQVLEQEIVNDSLTRARSIQRFEFSKNEGIAAEPAAADARAAQEEISIKRRGGWGTLVILGIIFFFLQILGIFFGYRHSFNGRLSKEAYRALRADSFSSYSELTQYYDRIADIAQSKIDRLQQLLEQKHRDAMGNALSLRPYSFREYLQAREAQRRDKPLGADADEVAALRGPGSVPVPVAPLALGPDPFAANGATAQPDAPTWTGFGAHIGPHARAAAPDPAPVFVPAGSQDAERIGSQILGGSIPESGMESARARLDLAERLERERAAARAARPKAPRRKSALQSGPEDSSSP